MLKDKVPLFEYSPTTITADQAEACEQLLHGHDASDLIGMLINPDQIATDTPDDSPDRPLRRSHIVTAFSRARRVA